MCDCFVIVLGRFPWYFCVFFFVLVISMVVCCFDDFIWSAIQVASSVSYVVMKWRGRVLCFNIGWLIIFECVLQSGVLCIWVYYGLIWRLLIGVGEGCVSLCSQGIGFGVVVSWTSCLVVCAHNIYMDYYGY